MKRLTHEKGNGCPDYHKSFGVYNKKGKRRLMINPFI